MLIGRLKNKLPVFLVWNGAAVYGPISLAGGDNTPAIGSGGAEANDAHLVLGVGRLRKELKGKALLRLHRRHEGEAGDGEALAQGVATLLAGEVARACARSNGARDRRCGTAEGGKQSESGHSNLLCR